MTRLTLDLDHFRARVLQDALTEARADQWLRRAQQFEDAAPRKVTFAATRLIRSFWTPTNDAGRSLQPAARVPNSSATRSPRR